MKKLNFLFVALLIAGTVGAQFFQRVYGTGQSREILESGMNYDNPALPIGQKGQVMCGFTNFNSANAISPWVTRTLLNGGVVFNNTYPLNFYGRAVDAAARRVITYPNGQIGVIGDWSYQPGTQHTNVFYMLLNPNGVVAGTWAYFFQNVQVLEATSITPSTAALPLPQSMYACGNITDFSGRRYPFVMCVNAFTGAPVWGYDYADVGMGSPDWTVEDLIESPYANQYTGTLDVALVGRHSLAAGGFGDGHWFTVDALTGVVSNRVYLFGTPNSEDNFNAITLSNNPFPSGVRGFAIAGSSTDYTMPGPNSNMWALKIGPNGNVVDFSSLMDYSMGQRNDFGYDIVERVSPTLGFQYFVGGYVDQGIFGGEDEVVYKLDFAGNAYPGPGGLNQFTWGGGGFERILQLDYYQNGVAGNNIGLSSFGWTQGSFPVLGQTDIYHVKSYFNGITPLGAVGGTGNCNHNQQWMNWMPGPPLLDSTKGDTVTRPKMDFLQWQSFAMQNAILCQQNAVAGGNNVRLASPGDLAASGTSLYPNPISRSNPFVNLAFTVPGYGDEVELELYNSLGQVVMHKRETLGDGQTTLQVNLGNDLSTGVYSLVVRREGEQTTHKIAVE